MIVWAGYNGTDVLNTGGRYNPGTDGWTATSITNAPLARYRHTAVWDGNEMIVWGGAIGVNLSLLAPAGDTARIGSANNSHAYSYANSNSYRYPHGQSNTNRNTDCNPNWHTDNNSNAKQHAENHSHTQELTQVQGR